MAGFIKGDIVIVPFPFSDLTQTKRRPALVIATLQGNDLILCQITSQSVGDIYAIQLDNSDFYSGGLNQPSNIRPNRLFTADQQIILYKAGQIKPEKLREVINKIVRNYDDELKNSILDAVAIAILLSHRLQGLLLAESAEYDDELNHSVLDGGAIAGKRFDWMLGRLKVS